MEHGTCKDCEWWGKDDVPLNDLGEEIPPRLYGTRVCAKASQLWNASEWEHDDTEYGMYRKLKPEYENDKMFVQDGSDYRASLFTMPEFYCFHWTKKDLT